MGHFDNMGVYYEWDIISRHRHTNCVHPPFLVSSLLPDYQKLWRFECWMTSSLGWTLLAFQNLLVTQGVKTLHLELQKLKKKSADEMRKNALSNYAAFIRTLRRIASLEGSLHSMRSFLSSQALLFHSLTEGEPIVPEEVSDERNMIHKEETITTEIEHLASKTLDVVDELMIERKFHEAVASLEEVTNLIRQAHREDLGNDRVMELEASLLQRRTSLVEQLSETTHQLSVCGQELRSALSALYHLGDGAHAQKLLFDSHHNRIHHGVMSLHLSGKLYVGGHTAALSQTVFSEILQTAKDSSAVFGDSPAYASRVIIWAFKELEAFVSLLKKSVLLVAGSLRAMVECMRITYGHCLLLQDHGLALCPFLSGLLRPVAKQIVHGKLLHMQDTLSALTAADDWRLAYPAISFVRSSRGSLQRLSGGRLSTESTLLVLSTSAHQFDGMVQGFGDDVSPLVDMHLEEGCLDGVRYLFDGFVRLLLMALNQARISRNTDQNVKKSQFVIRTAETLSQQLAILGSARVLAEEILPHAVLKLLHSKAKSISRKSSLIMDEENPDLANWRSYLNQGVMRLQDAFMNIYREIILQYACNGETKLIPELYIKYEIVGMSKDEMQKEMPSKFFQSMVPDFDLTKRICN